MARWVEQVTLGHAVVTTGQVSVEVVDLGAQALPLLDEPVPAMFADYRNPHTRRWSAVISSFDAFVFVTPEYNHSLPAALKNAIDFLYAEWNNKAAGFVAYGSAGGTRAVEQLRLVMAELQVATVRAQVALSLFSDFENHTVFKPEARHEKSVTTMLDQLVSWSTAMATVRKKP